ncbi:MAG: ABC transporter permease [Vampirovibrionales bacterium]|nr:ABC transporter permease [Vampirovibrionales bacterium]
MKKLWLCIGFLALMALGALLIPYLGRDPTLIQPDFPLLAPGERGFWLGTDDLGRDLLSRLAVGGQISLLIGLSTAAVAVAAGAVYGIAAALLEGRFNRVDEAMMRLIDVLYSLPGLMIVILFGVFWGRGLPTLVAALALFSWPDTARLIRAQTLALKREEFVEAYRSLGGGIWRLVTRHFLPNLAGLLILSLTIAVPRAILTESTLSFLGLGVEPPLSSWGTLVSEGWQLARTAPHILIFAALAIVSAMVALNLLGDALRERFDPKERRAPS